MWQQLFIENLFSEFNTFFPGRADRVASAADEVKRVLFPF